jgi:hypothetical protein
MKKIIYILAAASFAFTACHIDNDVLEDTHTTTVAPAPGTMVKVEFTVDFPDLPPMTRAEMAENPIINNMYVAVFGEGLYLQHWMPATIENLEAAGSDNKKTYSVMLPVVEESRTLHFIANPPAESNPPAFDYEWNIFPNMVTSGTEGAYWQRIELPDGILAQKNSIGEYIIDDDGNYSVDPESVEKLQLVYLVRNYAKIVVNSGSKMFDVGQWTLINYPDQGSVAPYDVSVSGHVGDHYKFSDTYMRINEYDDSETGDFYEDLTRTYIGYMPETAQINHTWPSNPVFVNSGEAKYMYERPTPERYQTSVVAQVIWKTQSAYETACAAAGETPGTIPPALAGNTYWYKIEILDNEGEYIPILRNIQYTVSIDGLNEAGYQSAQAAFNGDYFGNISSSLETSSLNEISNGVSRIYVDYMDQTFLGEETGQVLNYYFVPDDANAPDTKVTKSTGNVTISVTKKDVAGYVNPIDTYSVDYNTGKITFSLKPRTTELQKGIFRVEGKVGSGRALFREVTVNVIGNLVFTSATAITTTPTSDVTDQAVVINIGLDEKLPASLFPIQVRIEAEQNSLSSTSPNLPVASGPSKFASKSGQNSFYYIYTIDYSSATPNMSYYTIDPSTREITYKTNYAITLYTTKSSGNSTKIHISDINDYFTPTELTLTIP